MGAAFHVQVDVAQRVGAVGRSVAQREASGGDRRVRLAGGGESHDLRGEAEVGEVLRRAVDSGRVLHERSHRDPSVVGVERQIVERVAVGAGPAPPVGVDRARREAPLQDARGELADELAVEERAVDRGGAGAVISLAGIDGIDGQDRRD